MHFSTRNPHTAVLFFVLSSCFIACSLPELGLPAHQGSLPDAPQQPQQLADTAALRQHPPHALLPGSAVQAAAAICTAPQFHWLQYG